MTLAPPASQPDYVSVRPFPAFVDLLSVTEPVQACPRVAGSRIVSLSAPPDRGMYFILRLTQLVVRPDSRLGLLKYKIAPKCLLLGPFGHSGVGGNPMGAGMVRSYNLVFTYPCQPPPLTGVGMG